MKRVYLLNTVMVGVLLLSVAPARATPQPQSPLVGEAVTPKLSPNVRDLPTIKPHRHIEPFREINPRRIVAAVDGAESVSPVDPLLDHSGGDSSTRTPSPAQSFDGMSAASIGASWTPPDPNGDVGPNHYVQMVNVAYQVFDKSGSTLAGPTDINQLWTGQGGLCEARNDGDPIVLYDPLADRWLLSQFAVPDPPHAVCIAISQTPDPTGAYYLYEFSVPELPDYLKFGVWPDAYYMSANESSYTAYAFDRTSMLAGSSATYQRFTGVTNFMLPSDLDGSTPPPTDSPNYFYTFKDNGYHGGGGDRLEIYEFDVDWATPANSTFTLVTSIPVSAFAYTVCGFFAVNCIPQQGTGQKIDALSEWPMFRFAYRNFGAHESLVGNFAVDVGGDQSGIRWFELRKSGTSPWTLYQEGTHAPDARHRWNGSIAMDGSGNIALGYSVSSSTMYPGIRYATRLAGDTLGTLQAEATLTTGGGSQTGSNRWGDYSSMSVDPTDDCTFWHTNEYYQSSSSTGWRTRIGSFKLPECGTEADFSIDAEPASQDVCVPDSAVYTVTVEALRGYSDTVTLGVSGNPAGTSKSFSVNPVTPPATPTLTIGNTGGAASGTYSLSIVGTGPTQTHTATVQLHLSDAAPAATSLTSPADGSTGVATLPAFAWTAAVQAESYDIEIDVDPAFSSVVASATGLTDPTYTPGSALGADTIHYWRVRANNVCGAGQWSEVFAFRTAGGACTTYNSTDVPKNVPNGGTADSTLSVGDAGTIADVNVVNLAGTAWIDDLIFDLRSPDNTTVRVMNPDCGLFDQHFDLNLDDEASGSYPCPPTDGGTYLPDNALSAFDGEDRAGSWTLHIIDTFSANGQLNSWGLEICAAASSTTADYSDLPGSYGVAWHAGGGTLRLGTSWDADASFGNGDDDDSDDGVTHGLASEWAPGQAVTVYATVTGGSGYLAGWFDWNDDGDFADAWEEAMGQSVSAGANGITFTIPSGAGYAAGRQVDARFRLYASDLAGSETPDGGAGGGEVEDYTWDFYPFRVMLPLVLRNAGD